MEAPSHAELAQVKAAALSQSGDYVVHWNSSVGVIIIEVRAGQVYVNGDLVPPARETPCLDAVTVRDAA